MKHRPAEAKTRSGDSQRQLCRALLALDNLDDMHAFLLDLCTPAELEAMTDRWNVVPYVLEGVPYREIHERTGVSVTTIGRVARCLVSGTDGGYLKAVEASKQDGA